MIPRLFEICFPVVSTRVADIPARTPERNVQSDHLLPIENIHRRKSQLKHLGLIRNKHPRLIAICLHLKSYPRSH